MSALFGVCCPKSNNINDSVLVVQKKANVGFNMPLEAAFGKRSHAQVTTTKEQESLSKEELIDRSAPRGFLGQVNLGVPIPTSCQYVVRNLNPSTKEEREELQKRTEYNLFSFPAGLLLCDFLSCSGTTAMTDVQWANMHRGDESYGRNHGYYALLDAVRDAFERGDSPRGLVYRLTCGLESAADIAVECTESFEGGLVNGGAMQLVRPNFFITPQGRCAENLLFSTMRQVLGDKECVIPANGFFDTTEAHAQVAGFRPLNLFAQNFEVPFHSKDIGRTNPFKGDIDLVRLEEVIKSYGAANVPLIILTITNNTAAGQPVSMANMKGAKAIADKYDIPLFFDACRFAENAYFVQQYELDQSHHSIHEICQEMFSLVDGCWMSMKKDALCNMGGFLCFRDQGIFHRKFSTEDQDVGVLMKEKQILQYGNDSYGGMSGRDIMAASVGLYEGMKQTYLCRRIEQTAKFAMQLVEAGVPVILPPGGHAVYLDMDRFFEGEENYLGDFRGLGFAIELLRLYAIRCCELGPFAFEWDCKDEEQQKGVLNFVRFAIPRNVYNQEHIDYTVAAVKDLHRNRSLIPKVSITRGQELHLRHFQSGVQPHYDDPMIRTKSTPSVRRMPSCVGLS